MVPVVTVTVRHLSKRLPLLIRGKTKQRRQQRERKRCGDTTGQLMSCTAWNFFFAIGVVLCKHVFGRGISLYSTVHGYHNNWLL